MDYRSVLERIIEQVDNQAYLTPSAQVDPRHRAALEQIGRMIQDPANSPMSIQRHIEREHQSGRLDRVHYLSALHVLAASPRVKDWAEAARLAGEQEFAALEAGGPYLQTNLAAVDRHRGVVAYLRGHYETALDHFSRALERQRSAENLGNVLCTLIRLGELPEARALHEQIEATLPAALVSELNEMVRTDPDLALLRKEDS